MDMVYSVTTINQQGYVREFYGRFDQLEEVADLIAEAITQGYKVVNAYILGKNSSTSLPLEAFDEQSVTPMLQQLEQEWKQILAVCD
jgi:DNA-binding ferritin-like protein